MSGSDPSRTSPPGKCHSSIFSGSNGTTPHTGSGVARLLVQLLHRAGGILHAGVQVLSDNPFEENPPCWAPSRRPGSRTSSAGRRPPSRSSPRPCHGPLNPRGARRTHGTASRKNGRRFRFLGGKQDQRRRPIAADRHRSDAWRNDRPNGYPLYEFESSRLTNEHVHDLAPGALFGYNAKQSFGLLTFDTTAADPTIAFQIISIDKENAGSLSLKLSEISTETAIRAAGSSQFDLRARRELGEAAFRHCRASGAPGGAAAGRRDAGDVGANHQGAPTKPMPPSRLPFLLHCCPYQKPRID